MTRFIEALLSAPRPVIAEVKRRDANGVDLLGGRSVAAVMAGYQAAGAPCVSVVTGRWFGGDAELLREVRARASVPILQKDFLIRREQLRRAAESGVDAVLLTAGLLSRDTLASLVDSALGLGLTPFVEVTDTAQIEAVPRPQEVVIAVNNKDIRVAERGPAHLDRSFRSLPALRRAGTRCPVSASGIDSPRTAVALLRAGYAGLLVGTSLLTSATMRNWLVSGETRAHPGERLKDGRSGAPDGSMES